MRLRTESKRFFYFANISDFKVTLILCNFYAIISLSVMAGAWGAPCCSLINIKKIGVIEMAEENQIVRLSVRVSKENNDYLEKKSTETGISKSALVQIAVEQYRQQAEAVSAMNNMEVLFDQLGKIQDEIEDLKKW